MALLAVRVLTINCGSSTLKFDVIDVEADALKRAARGAIERIGQQATMWLETGGKRVTHDVDAPDYEDAVGTAVSLLKHSGLDGDFDAVVHRVVHGGPNLHDAIVIDDEVIRAVEAATELAPLHNAPALAAIRAARGIFRGDTPEIAAFDTAFFADLPPVAREYALPLDVRERMKIRRYGFHGLAHRYMVERYQALRPDVAAPRLITLQLGSGCSITASRGGRPLDTSMGYTPLEGLIMGTRSGDIDPMLPLRLIEQGGMTTGEVEALLNGKSGLLGLSGRSNDMRDLEQAALEGDASAALAIDAFCYRIRKYIGAYQAVLGGCDAIVFGGGIGERSARVRREICEPLAWCGIRLDTGHNTQLGDDDAFITAAGAQVDVLVAHVDEAAVIARDAFRALQRPNG